MTKQTKPKIECRRQRGFFIYVKERVYCPSISVESLSMASDPERSGDLMASFNKFLLQIANEIKSDELDDIKFVC